MAHIDEVRAFAGPIDIPTYEPAAPESLPIFYELRNYQNARGDIYPLPAVESISDEKTGHAYRAYRLENEYVRTTVLPELGGRVYEGYDKVRDYNFVYKNSVIKPALIGLCGPWISGGIEFNWPQHHRPTTFMPVDARLEDSPGGGKTVWVGEIEPKDGTKGMVGITVDPGRSYIKASVRLYNRTSDIKTFHWWANLAVHVNDAYRLVFPPDIDYVTFHYKNYVSPFPVVKGEFAKADFGDGRDVSWYKNVAAPASFFIFNSRYNFMAGYDEGRQCGTVHIADRHISPGKKFFTWGTDAFGQAWQKNLTDSDGPYIEIMTGCYTDNQPDFAWLMPYETKTFEQYWYPLTKMPHLKNATVDAAVSLGVEGGVARLAFNATGSFPGARYTLWEDGQILKQEALDLSPGAPFAADIASDHPLDPACLRVLLEDAAGRELVSYQPLPMYFEGRPAPKRHEAARRPSEIKTVEELYLNGLHIEQYRNPTFLPEPYYLEALRREPEDSRCNLAMGRLEMRKGNFGAARTYFARAVETLIQRNPNSFDGEAHYQLSRAMRALGDVEGALDTFQKAAWNYACLSCAMHESAEILAQKGDLATAAAYAGKALTQNRDSLKTRALLSSLWRRMGEGAKAEALCRETLSADPLDYAARFELYLLTGDETCLRAIRELTNGRGHALMPLVRDYLDFGCPEDALKVADLVDASWAPRHYAAAHALCRLGRADEARAEWALAEGCDPSRCNPTDFAEAEILHAPLASVPSGKAHYLLGNLYYARGNTPEAVRHWTSARRDGLSTGALHRNLALALFEKYGDRAAARHEMERAFELEPGSPRMLFELTALHKALCVPSEERLEQLAGHMDLVRQRYDLSVEYVALLNLCGRSEEALRCLSNWSFHTYEGGEGLLPREHLLTHVLLGREEERLGRPGRALQLYQEALSYPGNYHEGRKHNIREGQVYYHIARAQAALGRLEEAEAAYRRCASFDEDLDETGVYGALALRKLGDPAGAAALLQRIVRRAEDVLAGDRQFDYFEGFPAGIPFHQDMARLTAIRCLTALAMARSALGDEGGSGEALRELALLTVDTPWISMVRADAAADQ